MRNFNYKMIYLPERFFGLFRRICNSVLHRILLTNSSLMIGKNSRIYVSNICIGKNVYIGNNVHFFSELDTGYITIKDDVQIDHNCVLDCTGGIVIESNSHISSNVTIYTHSHGDYPKHKPIGSSLHIGNNVWIGEKSAILQNVSKIEDGTLVGYGSTIVKSILNKNRVYVGSPVREFRERLEDV